MAASGFTLTQDYGLIIDGKKVYNEQTKVVLNPSTEEVIARVPIATHPQLDETVHAASKAFPTWSRTPIQERQQAVAKMGALLQEHLAGFIELLMKEVGKARELANIEAGSCAAWFHALSAQSLTEDILLEDEKRKVVTRYIAHGVCAAITPWNFPMSLMVWKLAPALLTGNCVIVKPSPFAPLCAIKVVELAQQVFPPGVLSILTGDDNLGPWISAHPGISRISLTGSIAAGKSVMRNAASNLMSLTLELGGNDPAIIFPDVDPKSLAPRIFWGSFHNAGQICAAIKRVYVHTDVYDAFLDAFVDYAKTVKVGNPMEEGVGVGPLQNKMQYDKVKSYIDDCHQNGYKFALGGTDMSGPGRKGYFLPISIVDDPPEMAKIVQEEQFGPILPLVRWTDEDDMIQRANHGPHGLCATVWTNDHARAQEIARKLEAGVVWINESQAFHWDEAFGGVKHSGIGVEHGKHGLLSWVNIQTITLNKGRC